MTERMRIMNLVSRCTYPGLQFNAAPEGDRWHLRVENDQWKGRWWRLSPHMTDSEIVQTAFKAVMTWVEHEAREAFIFDGAAVFGPHFNVHDLVQLARSRAPDARGGAG